MYAQGNHQSGLAYNEVDYPHCKIYLMEPLLYQSLAQRKMEGNNMTDDGGRTKVG